MNRIRALREREGMTQSDLGKLLNVKDSAISKYESEKVPLTADTIAQLCRIFGVTSDYLLGIIAAPANTPGDIVTAGIDSDFGSRLNNCIFKTGDSSEEFSAKTGISHVNLLKYIKGIDMPSIEDMKSISLSLDVSTDYLLGFKDFPRPPKDGEIPFRFDPEISRRLKEQAAAMEEDNSFIASVLGIEESEVFNFFEYGFVPHISIFAKIVEHFLVSSDYLLNRTGSTLTVQTDEEELLRSYRALNNKSKTMALSRIYELEREESLVAAKDRYLDSEGKSLPSNGTEGGTMAG